MRYAIVAAALSLAIPYGPAGAAVISYQLNTVINGGSSLSSSASFGTVSFSDNVANPNKVDVDIVLNGTGWKVQSFIFNLDPAKFNNATAFVLTGGVSSYETDMNDVKADGYTAGRFDVETPDGGNIGTHPIHFTISLGSVNLNPGDFNFLDTSGFMYSAVHIGNCGAALCTPTSGTGAASIWVAAGRAAPVPEPASLALFGLGVAGLGLAARTRKARALTSA